MSEILAALFGACLGAVVTGYLSFVAQLRASSHIACTDLTLQLYDRWQSDSMIRARITSNVVLREALAREEPLSFSRLSDWLLAADRMDDWVAVSTVVHFFEQLSVSLQQGQVQEELFWRLFGRYIEYWREATLDPLAEVSRQVDQDVEFGWANEIARLERQL